MEKSQTSSIAVVSVIGALTCFLWLPLLPILVPLAVLGVVAKWAASAFKVEDTPKNHDPAHQKQSFDPTTPFSQGQAQDLKAWQSQASLPYPAGVDSLPFSARVLRTDYKSAKKLRRESRQIARVMAGLELRKPAVSF